MTIKVGDRLPDITFTVPTSYPGLESLGKAKAARQ